MATRNRIRKVLVANRGEIVRRVHATCRRRGIATVSVFSDVDRDAPFVREADEAIRLGGDTAASSYLCADAVVAAARRVGADAVHPGYGFLSEDASFATRCEEAGLIFLGPPPRVIAALGSKVEAKRIAVEAGVPILPSAELGGDADVAAAAARVGYPLLVKASAGGGGRGMRRVESEGALERSISAARREAKRGFGDDTVFLEKWLARPRHVEVQILGDRHGEVVHLFERECSIQRRHQKIVEESPSPVVDAALRERLGAAAVAVGTRVGYVGAGTVEFLLDEDGSFYFLEVNARLQVEHPVTEAITGLDLVGLQIDVAEGAPLPEAARCPERRGHAIEVRLCAEDPAAGLLPTTGTLQRFSVPPIEGVRVDSGVEDGSEVSPFYDSMLAKVIAWAADRDTAIDRLVAALRGLRADGVRTNRALLVGILEHSEFREGRTDTAFLERHEPAALARRENHPDADRLHALAAALLGQDDRRRAAPVLATIPSGWRNVPSEFQSESFEGADGPIRVEYRFARSGLSARIDGEPLGDVEFRPAGGDRVELEVDGLLRTVTVVRVDETVHASSPLGRSELRALPRHPEPKADAATGSLRAPMPGTVVRVEVEVGATVTEGADLVVLEAMKMEHHIRAPHPGVVAEVSVAPGDVVGAGAVLVVLDAASAGDESS